MIPSHGTVLKVFDSAPILADISERTQAFLDFLVFSSVYLALECVAMAYVSCFIQELPFTPEGFIIPFLIAFAIYNLNRKTDEDEDAINRQDRFRFTKRYERLLFGLSIGGIMVSLVLSALHGIPAVLVTLIPFVIGTLYSVRWLPPGLPYRRLKEIPFVKNIMVGIAWAFFLSLLPVYLNNAVPDIRTGIMCLLFFFWGIMASTIPDIRDRAGDAQTGVRTIPVIYGDEKTKRLLSWLNVLVALPLLFLGIGNLPLIRAGIILASSIYSHWCIGLVGVLQSTDFICDILADGQYIFFACGIGALHFAHLFP